MERTLKAVIFDFDGTITKKGNNIWKAIWKRLGYDVGPNSYYRELFKNFLNNEITHQQWCNLTCQAFIERKMDYLILKSIAEETQLCDGALETFKELKKRGFSLHIVSGNIKNAIAVVLGENIKYFDSINANKMIFDENGELSYIEGTKYDFKGKAKFIENLKNKNNLKSQDIIFVGNGENDEWVYTSGCKTICVNPESNVNFKNQQIWNKCLGNVSDFKKLINEIININTDYYSFK